MPMMTESAIDPARLAYLEWLFHQEETRQDNVATYRDYYDGDHGVVLTERQEEYLALHGGDVHFCMNLCQVVVDAMVDRLRVSGFTVSMPTTIQDNEGGAGAKQAQEPEPEPGTPEAIRRAMGIGTPQTQKPERTREEKWSAIIQEWWHDNRMDKQQRAIYKAAARDGDSYIVVSWDNEKGRPVLTFQPAFTSIGGATANGTGVKVHYGDDGRIVCATKRWKVDVDDGGKVSTKHFLNVYFPDRVEKYIGTNESNWQERYDESEDTEVWPLPWEAGKVPVFHFKNNECGYLYGESELKNVIPLQDVLNKCLVDLIADADYAAFRVMTQTGGEAPSGSIYPGAIWHNSDPEVTFGVVQGTISTGLLTMIDDIVQKIALVSRTPQYMLNVTGGAPSGESLKTAEAGLINKCKDRQVGFGAVMEEAMNMAIMLWNLYGDGEKIPEGAIVSCQWDDPATRTGEETRAKADFLLAAGYEEEALRTFGFDDAAIERMKREKAATKAGSVTEAAIQAQAARARFEQGNGPAAMQPGQFGQPAQQQQAQQVQPAQFGRGKGNAE